MRASAQAEAHALLDALDGRFIEPGPASAPTRGRMDVLPTGRNLFTVDPRAIPTAAAVELARLQERQMLLRHLQEEGEPLQRIVMDIWGSASLRTGGEDLALALLLMGVVPVWDDGSGRVSGIEIIPLAVLDRPRVDVTLRISGLFRDAFPAQIALFDQAVQAVAAREEDAEWNPLAGTVYGLEGQARADASARIFGAAPGAYGTGIEAALADNSWQDSDALGRSFIAGSGWAYGGGREGQRMDDAFALRMQQADAIVHVQDHAEMDILESPDIAAHEGAGRSGTGYGCHSDTVARRYLPARRTQTEGHAGRNCAGRAWAARKSALARRNAPTRLPRRRRNIPRAGRFMWVRRDASHTL